MRLWYSEANLPVDVISLPALRADQFDFVRGLSLSEVDMETSVVAASLADVELPLDPLLYDAHGLG